MDIEKQRLLVELLKEWFQETNETHAKKGKDRRWSENIVGEYIKQELIRIDHWKHRARNSKLRKGMVPPWLKQLNDERKAAALQRKVNEGNG